MKNKLSPTNFDQEYPDNEACLEWLKNQRYPQGILCPRCLKITRHHKIAGRPCYSCDSCGNQLYPTVGTIFHKSSTPLKTWFKVMARMSLDSSIPARQFQKDYGITYKTAWRMVKRVKKYLDTGDYVLAGEDNYSATDVYKTHSQGPSAKSRPQNLDEAKSWQELSRVSDKKSPDIPELKKLGEPDAHPAIEKPDFNHLKRLDGVKEENLTRQDVKRDRTARLLRLQILLWQNPHGLRIDEIARKCFTSKRTVYRDLKALESELGVPVWEDHNKRGLADGYFLPPIHFTVTEAFNIFIASRLLQKYSYVYNPSLAATLMKMNLITPEPLKSQIQNSIEYLEKQVRDETKIKNLNKLIQAWLSQHRVKFRYQDRVLEAQSQDLVVDSYFLEPVSNSRSIFVTGYCHSRQAIYSFKLDRIIGNVTICPETYEIPPDFDAVDYIDSTWGRFADEEPMDVKLQFTPSANKAVTTTIWHPSQKIEIQGDGSVIATYRIRNTIEFRSWLFGWGDEVEVLEPESFRRQVTEIVRALTTIYEK